MEKPQTQVIKCQGHPYRIFSYSKLVESQSSLSNFRLLTTFVNPFG